MFKNYERQYELTHTGENLIAKKCAIEMVKPRNSAPANTAMYIRSFKNAVAKFENDFFDGAIKIIWLSRRFTYRGRRRYKKSGNGHDLDRSYGVFLRHWIGFENRLWSFNKSMLTVISDYADDLFVNFDEGDPFKEKYEFPFSNISIDFLPVVRRMPERMEMLKFADKKKMGYTEFLDYVINYTKCCNDETGSDYQFIFNRKFTGGPVVKHYDKIT